jgi:hypothetical protein
MFRRHCADLLSLLGCTEFGAKYARRGHQVFSPVSVNRLTMSNKKMSRYCDAHSRD